MPQAAPSPTTRRSLLAGARSLALLAALPAMASAATSAKVQPIAPDKWKDLESFICLAHPEGPAVMRQVRLAEQADWSRYGYPRLPALIPANLKGINFVGYAKSKALTLLFGETDLDVGFVVAAKSAHITNGGMWVI